MIITVGAIKGGVGKSLTAINLTGLRAENRKVLLIDGDDQGTVSDWIEHRCSFNIPTSWVTIKLRGGAIRHESLKLQESFDDIFIDCGGRDTDSLRAALSISDIFLVPFQPKSFDIWTVTKVANLASEAQYINEKLKTYAFLNFGFPRGKDNEDAFNILKKIEGINVLPCVLHNRKAFSNSTAEGLTVVEANEDPKALHEMLDLYWCIFESSEPKKITRKTYNKYGLYDSYET